MEWVLVLLVGYGVGVTVLYVQERKKKAPKPERPIYKQMVLRDDTAQRERVMAIWELQGRGASVIDAIKVVDGTRH